MFGQSITILLPRMVIEYEHLQVTELSQTKLSLASQFGISTVVYLVKGAHKVDENKPSKYRNLESNHALH